MFGTILDKRKGKLWVGVLLLLPDDGPIHTTQVAVAEAAKHCFELLPHAPNPPPRPGTA